MCFKILTVRSACNGSHLVLLFPGLSLKSHYLTISILRSFVRNTRILSTIFMPSFLDFPSQTFPVTTCCSRWGFSSLGSLTPIPIFDSDSQFLIPLLVTVTLFKTIFKLLFIIQSTLDSISWPPTLKGETIPLLPVTSGSHLPAFVTSSFSVTTFTLSREMAWIAHSVAIAQALLL